jgi:succinate dehydrogenase hydrophobic membrane anchor protein
MYKLRLADKDKKSFRYKGSKTSGAFAYYFQRISGVVLVVLLFVHYFLMHYTTMAGHSHEQTVDRLSNPLWQAFYLTFLFLGMYHGLNGIWNIAQDYDMSPKVRMTIYISLLMIGIVFSTIATLSILTLPLKFA